LRSPIAGTFETSPASRFHLSLEDTVECARMAVRQALRGLRVDDKAVAEPERGS
jgi:hypothetical protein